MFDEVYFIYALYALEQENDIYGENEMEKSEMSRFLFNFNFIS